MVIHLLTDLVAVGAEYDLAAIAEELHKRPAPYVVTGPLARRAAEALLHLFPLLGDKRVLLYRITCAQLQRIQLARCGRIT
jgi:hypothetical protein